MFWKRQLGQRKVSRELDILLFAVNLIDLETGLNSFILFEKTA